MYWWGSQQIGFLSSLNYGRFTGFVEKNRDDSWNIHDYLHSYLVLYVQLYKYYNRKEDWNKIILRIVLKIALRMAIKAFNGPTTKFKRLARGARLLRSNKLLLAWMVLDKVLIVRGRPLPRCWRFSQTTSNRSVSDVASVARITGIQFLPYPQPEVVGKEHLALGHTRIRTGRPNRHSGTLNRGLVE